jgi:hypothetical protein
MALVRVTARDVISKEAYPIGILMVKQGLAKNFVSSSDRLPLVSVYGNFLEQTSGAKLSKFFAGVGAMAKSFPRIYWEIEFFSATSVDHEAALHRQGDPRTEREKFLPSS